MRLRSGGLQERFHLASVVANDVIECTPYVFRVSECYSHCCAQAYVSVGMEKSFLWKYREVKQECSVPSLIEWVTSSCQVRIFHVRFSLLNSPASGVLLALRVDHSEGLIQHVHSIDTIWTPNESSIFSIKVNLREYFSVSGLQQMEMIHWFS